MENKETNKKKKRKKSRRRMKRDWALIIDFEATCWEDNNKKPEGMHNEIIEIGISAVDYKTKEIRLRETIIVRPEHSEISEFCTGLTTITKEFIDEHGVSFAEACQILETRYKSRDRIWLSWGEYDKNQIARDCKLKGVRNPFGRTHFNLKPLFSFAYGMNTDIGVGMALEELGLEFEGTPHRGGDDAYNIARILQKVFIPLMKMSEYGETHKMEHVSLDEHLKEKYPKNEGNNNATRIINKTTPPPPNKENRGVKDYSGDNHSNNKGE